ncbi:juvenile hormone acid O-methyltransferase-like isoform X2 [Cimex lectularius]|nr:juvenile hormone acid O-methyltransferase-like isoform X2 [Cimex lectularius]XP_014259736.1 juvenile hormone acid O-methyltransferase-like isoform X2 [Cimex lectularius]
MKNARMYLTSNPMQRKDAEEVLSELTHTFTWSEGEKVLDVGSGPGDVTVNVLKKFAPPDATIIGSDILEEMVEYGNAHFKTSRIKFRKLDIQGSYIWDHWEKGSFSKIFSFYCLHWIQDQKKAAENIHSLLKADGELLATFLSHNPVFKLYLSLSQTIKWSHYMKDVEFYISPYHQCDDPAALYAKLLKSVDFSEVKVYNKNTSFLYPSKESMIGNCRAPEEKTNSICAVNPFLERIPNEEQADYRKCISDFVDCLNLAEKQENGNYRVDYSLLVARAKKV